MDETRVCDHSNKEVTIDTLVWRCLFFTAELNKIWDLLQFLNLAILESNVSSSWKVRCSGGLSQWIDSKLQLTPCIY